MILVPMIVTIGSAAFACLLVLTEVPGWQTVAAFLLMLGGIWLLRRVAGRIFHLGVLMYGQEPGIRELIRWLLIHIPKGLTNVFPRTNHP